MAFNRLSPAQKAFLAFCDFVEKKETGPKAIDFIKENLKNDPEELADIFFKAYKLKTLSKEQLCNLLNVAIQEIKDPTFTGIIIDFIQQSINYQGILNNKGFNTLNQLIHSLLLHSQPETIAPLIDKDFLANCFDDFSPLEQAQLTTALINDGLEEKSDTVLTEQQRTELYDQLIHIAIEKYNAPLLKKLSDYAAKKNSLDAFQQKIRALGDEKYDIGQFLLSLTEEADCWLVKKYMDQFAKQTFGNITLEGGLLTCAAIASRKNTYHFNPTVLDDLDQFEEYLNTLKATPPPHRERFILVGREHWICGDIQISPEGNVSILVIDSFGQEKLHSYDTADALNKCVAVFPNADVFIPSTRKQGYGLGCSMFSLDDVRHLFTVDKYLDPEKFQTTGLHGYLRDSAKKNKTVDREVKENVTTQIHSCELPLPLVRTMHSRRLLTELIPQRSEDEKAIPVNKKQELLTPEYAQARFFVEVTDESETKLTNVRLLRAMDKFSKSNLQFLKKTHDEKSIKEATEPFTLAGFEKRMADKTAKATLRSGNKNTL